MRQGETQGQKCLLIFRRKLGIPSLGSAVANLHSSYSGGTKSDKTRPIMRLAAYRVEIGTHFFRWKNRLAAICLMHIWTFLSAFFFAKKKKKGWRKIKSAWGTSAIPRLSRRSFEFHWFRWTMWHPLNRARFRGWTRQDTKRRRGRLGRNPPFVLAPRGIDPRSLCAPTPAAKPKSESRSKSRSSAG